MFVLDQITEAHSRVKSGADFPVYAQTLKQIGVVNYAHYVADGHTQYNGANGFVLSAGAKWEPRYVAAAGNTEQVKQALLIHQQGQTDYTTFCQQVAAAGIEKWVVDLEKMACIYYDRQGHELVVEVIPAV